LSTLHITHVRQHSLEAFNCQHFKRKHFWKTTVTDEMSFLWLAFDR